MTTTTQAKVKLARPDVVWRDLVPMRRRDGFVECCHPLPWLAASWAFAALALWPLAMLGSFLFFLTALRLNHEAIHGNLGFRPHGDRIVLHALSLVMLGSNNAVASNHLRHHRHLGTSDDIEGACGRMTIAQVLWFGPVFPVQMHLEAWRHGNATLRRRMRLDFALNLAIAGTAVTTMTPFLLYHVAAMAVAQCLTSFFAVWITHHDCTPDQLARTQRSALINRLSYNMFLHLEHHLFPGVPVRRLATLSRRIAAADPVFAGRRAMVVPEPFSHPLPDPTI